jgi:hypothetical protein
MAQEDTSMQVEAAQAPVPAVLASGAAVVPQAPGAGAVAPVPAQPAAAAVPLPATTAPLEPTAAAAAVKPPSPFEIDWPTLNASAAALEAAVAAFGPAEDVEQKAAEDEAEMQRLKARIDESLDVFEKCKDLPRDIKVRWMQHTRASVRSSTGDTHAVVAVPAHRQCLEAALVQRIIDQDRLINDWNEATAVLKDETKPMHEIIDKLVSSNAQLPPGARESGTGEKKLKRSGARQLT